MEDNVEAVDFLLKNGANPHIADFLGNDACDYAETSVSEDIKKFPEF